MSQWSRCDAVEPAAGRPSEKLTAGPVLATTSQSFIDARPELKPPASSRPLSMRRLRFMSTPFQCWNESPKSFANVW